MGRDLAAASDENLWATWRHIGTATPKGHVEEDRDLVIVETGSILPTFNPVFVKRVPRNAGRLVRRAVDRDVPVVLTANPSVRRVRKLVDAATEAGLVEQVPLPGMALGDIGPRAHAARRNGALLIERVGEARWSDYFTTLCAGFEVPVEMVAVLDDARLAEGANVAAFLGLADGVPIATSLAFITGRTVGIYNVGTVPLGRRRGFGEAMTWEAIRWGAARGCDVAVLQASQLGRPIYERMGFAEIVSYVQLMVPE